MARQEIAISCDFELVAKRFSELDESIQKAGKGQLIGFTPITLKFPSQEPSIHAFYTMVSWLYVLVVESAPIHFRFLSERASALSLDSNGELGEFCRDVQIFRTVLQHNLNLSDANDLAKLVRCEVWMAKALDLETSPGGHFWPNGDSQWRTVAANFCERSMRFAEANLSVLKRIIADEYFEDVLRDWVFRQNRSLPAHRFDGIVSEVAADMGLKHLDYVRIRRIHLEEWNKRIRLLRDSIDVQREARRLVEHTLLREATDYIPITGADIIEKLGIPPGPKVGAFLLKAKASYQKAPCSGEELLMRLKTSSV